MLPISIFPLVQFVSSNSPIHTSTYPADIYFVINASLHGKAKHAHYAEKKISSYQQVKTAPSSGDDSTTNGERSNLKLFSLVLVMTFLLVDFQSSSGFVQCVTYPACRYLCLAIWEVLYIVALIIYMPVKCLYRLVVEILIYELYDIFIVLLSLPVNIGRILLYSPSYSYQGFRMFFLNNSWA